LLFTLVDIGVMPVLRWWRWSRGFSLLLAAVLQLLVVRLWSVTKASGGRMASPSPIKAFIESPDLGELVFDPSLPLATAAVGIGMGSPTTLLLADLLAPSLELIFVERNTR
jgi:hypothetical protein